MKLNQASLIDPHSPIVNDLEGDDDLDDEFVGDQHSCASSVIVPFSQSLQS
jgi:hypothetical protein